MAEDITGGIRVLSENRSRIMLFIAKDSTPKGPSTVLVLTEIFTESDLTGAILIRRRKPEDESELIRAHGLKPGNGEWVTIFESGQPNMPCKTLGQALENFCNFREGAGFPVEDFYVEV